MKKYVVAILSLFILSLCCYKFISQRQEKPIHIFFETIGTSPEFGGLIQYVQLPQDEKKIVAWHRMPYFSKNINLKKENTQVILLPKNEKIRNSTNIFRRRLRFILSRTEPTPLVFYTGYEMSPVVAEIIREFPEFPVKHIHLYEDGFFNYTSSSRRSAAHFKFLGYYIQYLKKYLKKEVSQPPKQYPFAYLYPTTYHTPKKENLYLPKYAEFLKFTKGQIENIDLRQISKNMTKKEKRLFAQSLGFDVEKLKKHINGRPFYVFASGHIHDEPEAYLKQSTNNMLKLLKRAVEGDLGSFQKNAAWAFKLHPSLGIKDIAPDIKKAYPDIFEIPSYIPFETLILLGLEPDKLISTGSSFLFWLKPEQISVYIAHPYYTNDLLKNKLISLDKIVYPHIDKETLNNSFFIDGKEFVPESPNRACLKQDLFKCAKIKRHKRGVLLLWDSGEIEKIQLKI